MLANENTKKIVYLSKTVEGKKHDKKLADRRVKSTIRWMPVWRKTPGFKAMSQRACWINNLKKGESKGVDRNRQILESADFKSANRGRECDLRHQVLPDCQISIKTEQREYLRYRNGNSMWTAQPASYLSTTDANYWYYKCRGIVLFQIMSIIFLSFSSETRRIWQPLIHAGKISYPFLPSVLIISTMVNVQTTFQVFIIIC